MNNQDKIELFRASIDELAKYDYDKIEKEVEAEIKESIQEELEEYENKKKANYEKTASKIEKDFNKKIFNYELDCKKEIAEEERKLKEKIKSKAKEILKEFVNSDKYKDLLKKYLDDSFSKIENNENIVVGLTKQDLDKYGNFIKSNYKVSLKEIPISYIGGCTVESSLDEIYIDNTLLNTINEKMKG